MKIEFFVPGIARPAGSKSAFKYKKTDEATGEEIDKIAVTHANPKSKIWMDSVKWFAMKAVNRMILLTDAVRLELVFFSERPKNHYGTGRNAGRLKSSAPLHKITMPDLTKLNRAVEDALTGIIWKDDSQVVQQETKKCYCRGDEKPGVLIIIKTMDEVKNDLHFQTDCQLAQAKKQETKTFAFQG